MKISKIACSTLLGAIIVTGAYADNKNADTERNQYNIEKTKLEKSQIAEKKISSALQELKENINKLKSYDPSSHTDGDSKIIYDILKKIKDARKPINNHIGNIDYGGGKHDIEYSYDSNNKVVLTNRGISLEITINGQTKNFALNGDATKDDYASFFADDKKEIVIGLIDGFIKKFHDAVEVREDKVIEKEKEYMDKIVDKTPEGKFKVNTFSKEDADAINSILKDLPRELKETADALGTNHELILGQNNSNTNVKITIKSPEHANLLSRAVIKLGIDNTKLEDAKAAAKVLMEAGVKLKEGQNLSEITETSKVREALDIKDFTTKSIINKFKSDKPTKDAIIAIIIRDYLLEFNQDNRMINSLDTQKTEKQSALTQALEVKDNDKNKFEKQIAENNKQNDKKITLNKDSKKLAEQKRALDEIIKVLEGAAKDYDGTAQNQDAAKKEAFDEALAKAKAADVVIADNESKKASDLKTKVEAALQVFTNDTNDQIKAVVDAQQALDEAEKVFYDSIALRVNAFTKDPKSSLSSVAKDIISSMSDKGFLENKTIRAYITQGKDSLLSFLKANEDSILAATSEIGKTADLDIIKFSSELSTVTRLAKLSNPFNKDLALASAINNLSNDKFADNGDSVSSIVKSYTDRFNYDNNIWANVIGAKGKIKDSSNPELNGFSVGYDRAFDNTIFGGYFTLAKSKADSKLINTKANNYQVGLYGRTYIDNSEIDARLSFGKAKNKIQRNAIVNNKMLTQDGKYDTTFTSFAVDYGYVMDLSDSLFVKPIVGLDYSYSKSKTFKESGDLPLEFSSVTLKSLNAKLALEFRKYVDDGNYLYITPGFEAEVYKDVKDPVARFVGSSKDIKLKADDKKGRFATLKTGAELKLTDSLSTNINFGVKAKSKQQYFDGTVGLKYKF
ncbi:autotransporter domain-containing protein [Campylobacter pinnipediorum]|uniref:autotransporter domain-containing protein n=1 Tax=Campylobacter pinnipediorum TaxID=1965231 RepID=UPI00084D01AF|nr:autotransporter domain-containing protein [Campylobacter pinnipediorum]